MKSLYRRSLTAAKKEELLSKIKAMNLIFEIGNERIDSRDLTDLVIDEGAADDQIAFTRPGGVAVEYYDLTDIVSIRRLRTRRWAIKLADNADPAQATV
jgi:transcriptional regulator NrdR family protein